MRSRNVEVVAIVRRLRYHRPPGGLRTFAEATRSKAERGIRRHWHVSRSVGTMKRLSKTKATLLIAGCSLGFAGCLGIHVKHETPVYTSEAPPAPVVVTTPAVTTTTTETTGPVVTSPEVTVPEPPPTAPVEQTVVEPAPGPQYVWVDGYYEWKGTHWHWKKGHWERPPHHGAVWVAPKYSSYHGHYVWVPGTWE